MRTNRKDDIFMQRQLYTDESHTALDIFRFASFFGLVDKIFLYQILPVYLIFLPKDTNVVPPILVVFVSFPDSQNFAS